MNLWAFWCIFPNDSVVLSSISYFPLPFSSSSSLFPSPCIILVLETPVLIRKATFYSAWLLTNRPVLLLLRDRGQTSIKSFLFASLHSLNLMLPQMSVKAKLGCQHRWCDHCSTTTDCSTVFLCQIMRLNVCWGPSSANRYSPNLGHMSAHD